MTPLKVKVTTIEFATSNHQTSCSIIIALAIPVDEYALILLIWKYLCFATATN